MCQITHPYPDKSALWHAAAGNEVKNVSVRMDHMYQVYFEVYNCKPWMHLSGTLLRMRPSTNVYMHEMHVVQCSD